MPAKNVPPYQASLFHFATAGARLLSLSLCRSLRSAEYIPDGPCIFAPNHLSLLDGPLLVNELNRVLGIPVHMMSIKEPFDHPLVGPLMRLGGCVPYDRRDPQGGRAALALQLGFLREGQKVALFPEGHLGTGTRIRRCRMGMALLAMESGVPVVPVAIRGTERILPLGARFVRPGTRATITLAPPVTPAPWQDAYRTGDTARRREILLDFTRAVMTTVGVLSGQQVTW